MRHSVVAKPVSDRQGTAEVDARLRTEFSFELPHGYVDSAGTVHRLGTMRLATARDELSPLIDQRVRENPAYLGVVLLSLVITRLGAVPDIHAGVVEQLFATDLAYLQDFYRRINGLAGPAEAVACPSCGTDFALPAPGAGRRLGES
ncbi:hypothetical protein [Streptomyces palmae]|uniref:Phage tail assembly protein n=1 Tax=Streptomyces palmae TaxID=1701085 RepID=A0A4Z0H9Y1_9ACTN|nr:hypothetical protein [Streptomyces palmae]TGB10015.1 hypothetical protein E4099_13110 [Streptomyces palmae]